jgi:hypothetical protein
LDQYYIPTRYPGALAPPAVPFESYTEEQGGKAVQIAKALVSLIRQKLRAQKTVTLIVPLAFRKTLLAEIAFRS